MWVEPAAEVFAVFGAVAAAVELVVVAVVAVVAECLGDFGFKPGSANHFIKTKTATRAERNKIEDVSMVSATCWV